MATTPKTPKAPKADKPKTPPLDLSGLAVADAAVPGITRQRKHRDNPFVAHLTASRDNSNAGKSVTVPDANATEVMYLIRAASNELGCGARIVEQKNGNGTTTLLFAAKPRRKRKTKAEAATAAAAATSDAK